MTTRRKATDSKPSSMRVKAYFYIHRKILSGELAAGSALSEASLARNLGISRTPLREAIGQLVAEGFLKQIPNRGTVVLEFTQRDIAELYELREALEVYAVGKATQQQMRPADLEALNKVVDEIPLLVRTLQESGEARLSVEQMQRFVQMDHAFHAMLLRMAGNSRVMKVVGETRVLLNIFAMRRHRHSIEQLTEIHRYHREILEAIVRKDGPAAMQLLGEHIRVSKQERLEDYEDWEREKAMRSTIPGFAEEPELTL